MYGGVQGYMSVVNKNGIPCFPVSVHLLIISQGKILMLRRYKTGYEDGKYSLVVGKLEQEESVAKGMIREAEEEVGIKLTRLHVVHVMNRSGDDCNRIDYFFLADEWEGIPFNAECNKCDKVEWFDIKNLPTNTIPYINCAISHILNGEHFSIYGWTDT